MPGAGAETDVSTATSTSTAVEIFGSTYHVRGSDGSSDLRELARLVDGRMRELAGHAGKADPARLAILVALNLADELSRAQKQQEGDRIEIREKVAELARGLERALEE
jgi:cell division protein ZapA